MKRMYRSGFLKTIAFLTIIGSIITIVITCIDLSNQNMSIENVFINKYIDSYEFKRDVTNRVLTIESFMKEFEASGEIKKAFPEFPNNDSVSYTITNGKTVLSNVNQNIEESYFKNFGDIYCIISDGVIKFTNKGNVIFHTSYYHANPDDNISGYLGFDDNYIAQKQLIWESNQLSSFNKLRGVFILLLVSFVLFIYLIIVAGKNVADDEVHLNGYDKIYTEILGFIFIVSSILSVIPPGIVISEPSMTSRIYAFEQMMYTLLALSLIVSLYTFLAIVKKIKAKLFFKQTIVYKIFNFFFNPIRILLTGVKHLNHSFQKMMLMREVSFLGISLMVAVCMIIAIIAGSFLALMFLLIVEIAIIGVYIKTNYAICRDMGNLCDQIEKVNGGELNYISDMNKDSVLFATSQKLCNISDGLSNSINSQMKSQRMKAELITNVSHDLKTPLTSIISYIDLLSGEENLSEDAKDYVKILKDKSLRLKNIVSDLFDLAKTSSGDVTVELEKLDIKRLIEQTTADMDDKIKDSGLTLKQVLPETEVMILADGKKLYRVFQNVIDNALKYSLGGTRIYIELICEENMAISTIKNISNYEMNFTKEEIMERFARGDKARTSEGNGLGLSIAESFTNVCGGIFDIIIDGDQFKVVLKFPIV